jgi:hypothetical protein
MMRALPRGPAAYRLALAVLVTVFGVLAAAATRHNSETFDEILFPAVGARGFATGDFSLLSDHPVLMQYVYGLPVYLSRPSYPAEDGWQDYQRYHYARAFFWQAGNDPDRLALLSRLAAVLMGALLVVATYVAGRRHMDRGPALLAATLVAFLPDVLAHAGIAYNDLPLALAILVTACALDTAVRTPTVGRVGGAGIATALTVCVKATGLVVVPILVVLLALEALSGRGRDAAWRRHILRAVPVYGLAAYLTCVALYRGDFALADLIRVGMLNLRDATGRPSFLLGHHGQGWWYFFPVVFFLKTAVAFHALMVLAAIGAWLARGGLDWRARMAHPVRVPVVAASMFAAMAMSSTLNIGFRHVLPVMPFIGILVAHGLALLWQRAGSLALRLAIGGLVLWSVVSAMRYYPYFLPYLSEYVVERDRLHEVLVDSNTDWGQGLIALRDFMRARGIPTVALSYFGSAPPEAYGIRYDPMPGHHIVSVPPPPPAFPPPRFVAISATNLAGNYLPGDPFAAFRSARPVAVLAHTIYVYEIPR